MVRRIAIGLVMGTVVAGVPAAKPTSFLSISASQPTTSTSSPQFRLPEHFEIEQVSAESVPAARFACMIRRNGRDWRAVWGPEESTLIESHGSNDRKSSIQVRGLPEPFAFDVDPYGHVWIAAGGRGGPARLMMAIPGVDYQARGKGGDPAWQTGAHPWSPPVTPLPPGMCANVLCLHEDGFPDHCWGSVFVTQSTSTEAGPAGGRVSVCEVDKRGSIVSTSTFVESSDGAFQPVRLVPGGRGCLYLLDMPGLSSPESESGTSRFYRVAYTGGDVKRPIVKQPFDVGPELAPGQVRAFLDLQSADSLTRETAIDTLQAPGSGAVVAAARQLLRHDKDPFISAQLLWVLAGIGTPDAIEAIAEMHRTRHHLVRALAVRLLRDLAPSDLEALVAPLKSDLDPETRIEVALCHADRGAVVTQLLDALFSPMVRAVADRRLRYQAAMELSRRAAAAHFIDLVSSPDEWRRLVGWIALDVGLLENTNPAARRALRELLATPPAGRTDELLDLADWWPGPDLAPPLRSFSPPGDLSAEQRRRVEAIQQRCSP